MHSQSSIVEGIRKKIMKRILKNYTHDAQTFTSKSLFLFLKTTLLTEEGSLRGGMKEE